MTTFNPNKPVQTRDGREARIIASDVQAEYPIIAAIKNVDGSEFIETYKVDGASPYASCYTYCEDVVDLVNVPEKKFARVLTTPRGALRVSGRTFPTLAQARNAYATSRISGNTLGYVSYTGNVSCISELTFYSA